MRYPPRPNFSTVLLATVLLCSAPAGWPQTPEARLKAAYVLNFTKFTHWPEVRTGTAGPLLGVCMVGRCQVGEALEASFSTRIAGRTPQVDYVRLPGDVSHCDLLYISELDPLRARRILAAMAELPILTVSAIEGFARQGGMIELVVVDRRLRFEINLEAVRAAGLRLDPNLLKLADRVYGRTALGGN